MHFYAVLSIYLTGKKTGREMKYQSYANLLPLFLLHIIISKQCFKKYIFFLSVLDMLFTSFFEISEKILPTEN